MNTPNLFIIGAMKASTTSLHEALNAHPDIFMCTPTEPSFFAVDSFSPVQSFGHRTKSQYLELFAPGAGRRYRGESSTNYTKWPLFADVPARVHAFAPDARLIYLMRDPVERAISHYWHRVRAHQESRPPMQALQRDPHILACSRYGAQLEQWLGCFAPEQIRLITAEQLRVDTSGTLSALFEWLDLDPAPAASILLQHHNETPDVLGIARPGLTSLARRWESPRFRPLKDSFAAPVVERLLYSRLVHRSRTDLTAERLWLQSQLQSDVEKLQQLWGRATPEWAWTSAPNGPTP